LSKAKFIEASPTFGEGGRLRHPVLAVIAQLDQAQRRVRVFDIEEAAAILDSLPDLTKPLAEADPELRRSIFEAFRLRLAIDRNSGLIRLKRSYRAPSVK
jgi:hypothetical protein